MIGIIYFLKNKTNNKFYIGQTIQEFGMRLNYHINFSYSIGRAIRKYGIENFKIYKFFCPIIFLNFIEILMIKIFNSTIPKGYNIQFGGFNRRNQNIKVICIETNKIYNSIKDAKRDIKCFRSHISACCKNKRHSAGGYHWRYLSDWNKMGEQEKIIYKETFSQAGEKTGIHKGSICKVCKGLRNTAGGYHWMFIDEYKE
jgi:hypothetical protein